MKKLDELIEEWRKEFVKSEPEQEEEDPELKKHRQFFFPKMQNKHYNGACPKCNGKMRIHLSTFVCEACEAKSETE